jgi:tripeptidyl-peptidase-1
MHLLRVPALRCRYGAYLSREEVAELVAPHQDTLQLVQSWLTHHGVQPSSISRTHGGGWLTVSDVPVSKANELLGASYQLYRYAGMNDTAILRTVSYSLPEVLHAHVQTVVPTTFFASERTLRHKKAQSHPVGEAAGAPAKAAPRQEALQEVDPSFLRSLYKTATYVPGSVARNSIGILGVADEFAKPSDLTFFMAALREEAIGATFTVELVNGGTYNKNQPGNEASLDMQYVQAMAFPTPVVFYSVGGNMEWTTKDDKPTATDAFSVWLNYLLKKKKAPLTIVGSFGAPERDLPGEYASAVCFLFAQLTTRGVSILFATGDDGVGPGDCKYAGGTVEFMPNFPTSCMCGILSVVQTSKMSLTTSLFSQVLLSPASAARWVQTPKSRLSSLRAAFPTISHSPPSRKTQCLPSSIVLATNITACTRAFLPLPDPTYPYPYSDAVKFAALPAAGFPTSLRRRSTT